MNSGVKEIVGAVLAAVGTVISALSVTPHLKLSDQLREGLDINGNVLQAVGNGLQAEGQGDFSLEKVGNEIQSVGNSLTIAGLIWDVSDSKKLNLIATGNWFQALGSLAAFADELEDASAEGKGLILIGNLLQGIGNSLQALAAKKEIILGEQLEIEELGVAGSWIQATGAVLSAIGQFKDESDEK
ncbi:hypothetical protein LS684_08915 [Cytobacillus spongiae]|uniref:DUF6944 family repetitive protein n=1 Tax=Cytobacillus spongiae TaxID=2901381 RepID=UPI001F2B8C67|nr:hypothetical protein [Cytobacillus spongiae]UII57531.1 hypothetical protein LS684_08915 [Cytobacillus spongiae]